MKALSLIKGPSLILGLLALPLSASAQLLPPSSGLGGVSSAIPKVLDRAGRLIGDADLDRLPPQALADRLRAVRTARIRDLLQRHGDYVELDDRRELARRGIILLTGAGAAALAALRQAGYGVEATPIEGLDLPVITLTTPRGQSLARAMKQVRTIAPDAQASADNLYFPNGASANDPGPLATGTANGRAAGLIDGGVARHPALSGAIEQRGFARGAPRASGHGTAVASLISGSGPVIGSAPGAPLLVADVYGNDPAGGGAFAIARALGWMAARGAPVVTVSLTGPGNPLLAGAIRLAREKGVTIVAAVGNDGPAAPPAYPASYPGVIAVTGIDKRNRLLPEAGHALHVDFAAPGADMQAAHPGGGKYAVRGTSFAAPLVAGRLFSLGSLARLQGEAQPSGKPLDTRYGRGIICGQCRNMD